MRSESSKNDNSLANTIVDKLVAVLTWVLPAMASCLVIYLCIPFLKGGLSIAWDDNFHQSTQKLTAEAIANGRNPLGLLPTHLGLPGFRFYQFLHYFFAGIVKLATGLSTTTVHNWLIALMFASTPWTYRRFCLSIGLPPLAAGAAGLLYIGSINGTSNSFEAYFELGFLTQVISSVLLPLAMASLITLIKEGRGFVRSGVLMALTILAHAMFAVYAALAAGIAVAIYLPRKKKIWVRICAAAALAGVLAAAWAIPFVNMQHAKKPVTDVVARPDRIHWFAGLQPDEMGRFLVGGRLLDGGKMDGSSDAKMEVKMNMMGTAEQRFPFVTILTGIGLIFALIGFRDPKNRYLLAGLATGIIFMLGSDDFPLLFQLPLINKVQAFRVSYFIEFFAVALAVQGLMGLGALVFKVRNMGVPGIALKYAGVLLLLTGAVFFFLTMVRIVTPMMDTWKKKDFDKYVTMLNRAGDADPQKRVAVKFRRPGRKYRYALEHRIEVKGGYRTVCNHWVSPSPTANLYTCTPLSSPWRFNRYARISGVRYMIIPKTEALSLVEKNAEYTKLGHSGRIAVVEDKKAAMLHEVPGPRVLVVATPGQWYWLGKYWVRRWSARIGQQDVPWLLMAPSSALADKKLIESVDAVMYLDHRNVDEDISSLKDIAKSGTKLYASRPIEGVGARVFKKRDVNWEKVLGLKPRAVSGAVFNRLDGVEDPAVLEYKVSASKPSHLILSMQHFDNWRAYVDGEPVTVMSTGPDLVAVIVPAGEHEVRFAYEATVLESVSMGVSLFGWIGVLGFGVFLGAGRLRRKLRKPTPT